MLAILPVLFLIGDIGFSCYSNCIYLWCCYVFKFIKLRVPYECPIRHSFFIKKEAAITQATSYYNTI
ncbi:hypothetical protein COI44_04140 [Bacillus sp. AFS088145]|nr:hypothetical protein COI44_04140 [Bacillus sp. AFS088145]